MKNLIKPNANKVFETIENSNNNYASELFADINTETQSQVGHVERIEEDGYPTIFRAYYLEPFNEAASTKCFFKLADLEKAILPNKITLY